MIDRSFHTKAINRIYLEFILNEFYKQLVQNTNKPKLEGPMDLAVYSFDS